MAGKPVGERVATLEAYYIEVNESLKEIKERLATLNGDVADNSKFRVQQKTVYWVIGGLWALSMAPVTAIAVAVL